MWLEKLGFYNGKYNENWEYTLEYLYSLSFHDLVKEVEEVKKGYDNSKNLEDKDAWLNKSMYLTMYLDHKYNLWLINPIVLLSVNDWKIEMSYEYGDTYIKILFDENFAHKSVWKIYFKRDSGWDIDKTFGEIISREDLPINKSTAEEIKQVTSTKKANVVKTLNLGGD